jgi:hypothetical protein
VFSKDRLKENSAFPLSTVAPVELMKVALKERHKVIVLSPLKSPPPLQESQTFLMLSHLHEAKIVSA